LTGAVCTLKQIRDMASEMLEAQREWLPEFGNRKIRPAPTISIPKDVKTIDVPLDPALAIHKRFGQLITQKTE
jgi:alpha-galactosidase